MLFFRTNANTCSHALNYYYQSLRIQVGCKCEGYMSRRREKKASFFFNV
jgi:hypothetical protein